MRLLAALARSPEDRVVQKRPNWCYPGRSMGSAGFEPAIFAV